MKQLFEIAGTRLARFLATPRHLDSVAPVTRPERLLATLRPGDVLLVEGNSWISNAIKYLTQSTWSHAALFVADAAASRGGHPAHGFIEADMAEGVRCTTVDHYAHVPTRICRPVGLSDADCARVVGFAVARIGLRYDLRNIIDLARYLLPTPPVPQRFRRRMIALGSGDPTRAICSTLIAQAFQSVHYPILPSTQVHSADRPDCPGCVEEILRIRHHSLFTPRDFDISPYFQIMKPLLDDAFDYRHLRWAERQDPHGRSPTLPQGIRSVSLRT